MADSEKNQWREKLVSAETVLQKIEPGMGIFLGTGVVEPQHLIKALMGAEAPNLQDLELIQLVSLGSAVSLDKIKSHKYRLKTFFSGWVAGDAIASGQVDLIPARFSGIPHLIASGVLNIDVAFVQVTPPDDAGYCSLGVAVDVARQAMEQASLVVGEINPQMPVTYGDTFIPVSDFDLLVESDRPLICFDRWPLDEAFDRRKREKGMRSPLDLEAAVIDGAVDRVRPKLMTVATTLIALLPVMIGTETGAQVMKRIAAPMVGGLVSSTVLTLVIIPVVYDMWRRRLLAKQNE